MNDWILMHGDYLIRPEHVILVRRVKQATPTGKTLWVVIVQLTAGEELRLVYNSEDGRDKSFEQMKDVLGVVMPEDPSPPGASARSIAT